MDISLITSYFESPIHSNRAPYNEQLFLKLKHRANVDIIRPINWTEIMRAKQDGKQVDRTASDWNGMAIQFPVAYVLPKIGHRINGHLFYYSILSAFKKRQKLPDIIFSSWAYPDGFAAMKLAKKYNRPLVLSVLGSDINVLAKRPEFIQNIKQVLNFASAVFTPSDALTALTRELVEQPEKIHTAYCGIDPKRFFPIDRADAAKTLNLDPNTPRVIYIGNFKVAKGVIDLLSAASKIKQQRSDFEVILAGKGEDANLVNETIKDLGLEDVVRNLGEVNHSELNTWINASSCLSLPSYAEGLPNVVLEALKTETNVVATKVGGIPEAIKNADQCLVEPGDIDALAQRLSEALFDPSYKSEPGFVIGTYDDMADNIYAHLENVFR